MHVGITGDGHQLFNLDTARAADASQIVAFQINQHHMLGALLEAGGQACLQLCILDRIGGAWMGAGNRAGRGLAIAQRQEPFG